MDQDVTASTGASSVCTTDSTSTQHREVNHDSDQPSTGLQTDHQDITHDGLHIDHTGLQVDHPDLAHTEREDDLVMQTSRPAVGTPGTHEMS